MPDTPSERRIRAFVVADRSMQPTLESGQGLLAWRDGRVEVGQLRVFLHPARRDFWLVKRVSGVDGDRMTVSSDNERVTDADSRSFGAVPIAGSYRVLLRVPKALVGRAPRTAED